MDKEYSLIKMVLNMMGSGIITKCKDKEVLYMTIQTLMKEPGKKIKNKDTEYISGQWEDTMKEIGIMIR